MQRWGMALQARRRCAAWAARHEPAVTHELDRGTGDGLGINAVVAVEALVLERKQHFEVFRVGVLGIERQPPLSIRRRERSQ